MSEIGGGGDTKNNVFIYLKQIQQVLRIFFFALFDSQTVKKIY